MTYELIAATERYPSESMDQEKLELTRAPNVRHAAQSTWVLPNSGTPCNHIVVKCRPI